MAGEVLINGQKAAKPGQLVAEDAALEALARPPYVGRGGYKLAAALRHFQIDIAGRVCLDIGASTGSFTDALLQAGAARVHAVDVGSGRLAGASAQTRACPFTKVSTPANWPSPISASLPTSSPATRPKFDGQGLPGRFLTCPSRANGKHL